MQQQTLTLGIRGYKLANKDIFSKSDPYIVISKPVNNGGYTAIRTSETIKNDLNPVWRTFTLYESELPRDKEKFRFEVYDDDGKLGHDASDDSIGVGFFSMDELGKFYNFNSAKLYYDSLILEQSYQSRLPLQISDKRWNKKSGNLIITELKKTETIRKISSYSSQPPSSELGYPPAPSYQTPYNPPTSSNCSRKYSGGGFVLPGRN